MARKQLVVSDLSNATIDEGTGAVVTVKFHDRRKGLYVLDMTDGEAEELGKSGRKQASRGRRPAQDPSQN